MLILNSDNEKAALFKQVHQAYFSHQSKTMNEA